MRVVILTQHYRPEPWPKAHELAEGLRSRGHAVTVITGFPNYPLGRLYPGYRVRPWSLEDIEGVEVVRLALYPNHSLSSALRILNYLSFAAMAAVAGPVFCRKADAMFVFHPPLSIGVSAASIGAVRRLPYVYAVADLWPEAIVSSGMVRSRWIVRLLERAERFVYRSATVVAPVTEMMRDHLISDGVPQDNLTVIHDWADERTYYPVPPQPAVADRYGLAGRFNVVFGGQLGLLQKLGTIIDAAQLLRHQQQIQFVIVGDGIDRDRLVQEAASKGLDNVRFIPRVPPAEIREIYALAGALLVHLSADPIFRVSVPAKVYSYMACGRPILAAAEGATADLVRRIGAGLVCRPEDPQDLAHTTVEFTRLPESMRQEMSRRVRETFLSHYSRAVGLDRCEMLLADIASAKTARGIASKRSR